MTMVLPLVVPDHSYTLYWDPETTISVTVKREFSIPSIPLALDDTLSIYQAAYGHRFPIQNKTPTALFTKIDDKPLKVSFSLRVIMFISLNLFKQDQLSSRPGNDLQQSFNGLIRDRSDTRVSYIFKEWLAAKPSKEL
jgi:hypothetical protein